MPCGTVAIKEKTRQDRKPIDGIADTCYNACMSKGTLTISEVLRTAIENSGLTRYRIATETGIPETSVMRFMAGKSSLRLDKADKLAAYLGLRLMPDPAAVPPEPTPEKLARPMLAKPKAKRKSR